MPTTPKPHSEIPGDLGRAAKLLSGMRDIRVERKVSLEGLCSESHAPTCTRRVGHLSPHLMLSERGFMRTPLRACHLIPRASGGTEGWCLSTLRKSKGQRQHLELCGKYRVPSRWVKCTCFLKSR